MTHRFAKKMNMKGRRVTQYMETMGREVEEHHTILYTIKLKANDGKLHKVGLFGMDKLMLQVEPVDVTPAYEMFPFVPAGALDRPVGEVNIMLGQQVAHLLPPGGDGENCQGSLRVMRIEFGTGYVLGGRSSKITGMPLNYSDETHQFKL